MRTRSKVTTTATVGTRIGARGIEVRTRRLEARHAIGRRAAGEFTSNPYAILDEPRRAAN